MKCGDFGKSFMDAEYRKSVESAINETRLGLEIIGNNLLCINYPEILYAIRKARSEGASVAIYCNKISRRVTDWLINSDVEIYQGKKVFSEEYIINDGSKVITSHIEDGYRIGSWSNSLDIIHEKISIYDSLINDYQTKKINSFNLPVGKRMIKKPKTYSRKELEKYRRLSQEATIEVTKFVDPDSIANIEHYIRKTRSRIF